MAVTASLPRRHLEESFLNVRCPECGEITDEGMCYTLSCRIGFYNVQVELGNEIPEDYYMVEVEREPDNPAPSSLEDDEELEPYSPCPSCGQETDHNGACWNRYCPDGSANIGDQLYHEAVDLALEGER